MAEAEEERVDLLHAWYLSLREEDAARERRQKAHAARLAEEARLAAADEVRMRRKLCCMVPLFREDALRRFLLHVHMRDQPSGLSLMMMTLSFLKECVVRCDDEPKGPQHWLERAGLVDYGEAYRGATGVAWQCNVRLPTVYALQLMAVHLRSVYARHGSLAMQEMPPAWYVFGKRSGAVTHARDCTRWLQIDRRRARAEACAFLGAVYALCRTHLHWELHVHVLDALLLCDPVAPGDAVRAAHADCSR
jgi:hypothetical protein